MVCKQTITDQQGLTIRNSCGVSPELSSVILLLLLFFFFFYCFQSVENRSKSKADSTVVLYVYVCVRDREGESKHVCKTEADRVCALESEGGREVVMVGLCCCHGNKPVSPVTACCCLPSCLVWLMLLRYN